MNNPCIRCGKQRIISKEWTEKITTAAGVSTVTYTESICPDPACQKIVLQQQAIALAKSELVKKNQEERKNQRVQLNLQKKKEINTRIFTNI